MDALAEFFPLLLVVLYYLVSGRRKAAQRKQQATRASAPQESLITEEPPRAPTPFQSFLTQLEEAMAEANGTAKPVPMETAPTPPPPPRPTPSKPRLRAEPEFHAISGSFDSPAPIDHNRHGFGEENPLSEESFERRTTAPAPAKRRSYDPHGLARPASSSVLPAGWRDRLHDAQTARDAFVLQTLFGPRGGRRAERR